MPEIKLLSSCFGFSKWFQGNACDNLTVNTIKCFNIISSRIADRMERPSKIKPKPSSELENRLQADETFLCSSQLAIKFKHIITTDNSHNKT